MTTRKSKRSPLKPLSRIQRRSIETSVAVALDTQEQITY